MSLRDVPSREWASCFAGLVLLWVLSELFVGRLGLHARSLWVKRILTSETWF